MATSLDSGRSNQKQRTRAAILAAARTAVQSDQPVTMPAVAVLARVSEATAYRYFPDLAGLLLEALADVLPAPHNVMAPVVASKDVVERVTFAVRTLLREVIQYEHAVRMVMASAIARRGAAKLRAGRRYGLIAIALEPVAQSISPERFEQLSRSLSVIVSADAFFNLTDLSGLEPDEAISTIERLATIVVDAVMSEGQDK